ncbi:MAG: cation transporter [Micropepsaceae bacterium]
MDHCCHVPPPAASPEYRRVLWIALAVNALMFFIEALSGLAAGSASLQADALDFFGDAANYAVSLFVLGMALVWRSRAALVKGASMGLFGVWVLWTAMSGLLHNTVPQAATMGTIGVLALFANVGVAVLLYRFREGDANMRSVWLCTRNDAIGNLAVMAAALGVFGTSTAWPDILVAVVMASLAISASWQAVRQALQEMRGQGTSHSHVAE